MQRVYLVSKVGDVLLGFTTGVFAYYLYERKNGRAEEDKLVNLVRWKWAQQAEQKQVKAAEAEGWEEIERELKVKQGEQAAR
ncbi:hypothetical protein JCM10213_003623 [Rhodosporidiobolus nylandii]